MSIHVDIIKVEHFFMKNLTYMVYDTFSSDALLVDPAWDKQKIEKAFDKRNINLKGILITHHHSDHMNLAAKISRNYGVAVYMSSIEIQKYGVNLPDLYGFKKNEELMIGSIKVIPIVTPGHTAGSTSYFIDKNLFTGDTLFFEGCGICWGDGADAGEMYDSLKLLSLIIPNETRVFPGHIYSSQPGETFEVLKKHNIYMHFPNKEDFIKYRMRKNQKNLFKFK